jgi:hypothetical protein
MSLENQSAYTTNNPQPVFNTLYGINFSLLDFLILMKKRNLSSILDNITATKNRSQKFRVMVLVLFTTAIIVAFIALITMATES